MTASRRRNKFWVKLWTCKKEPSTRLRRNARIGCSWPVRLGRCSRLHG
ncbi:hypothetical protein SORBI_3010G090550 [Sorghum bicolor]|uniref:Uncharacterized protein n=1 Tax=Sorghum bicolor TaxID=4558 RepID=A0A1W0VS21_SORBI|nr:hypothetical protein SORBI_3010G090550 [Sorghum bicolor]